MPGWAAALATLAYVCAMFALAHFGDTRAHAFVNGRARPAVYALGLAVYCTSWTFFGSVGLASTTGFGFLPIYIGPLVIIGLCHPFVRRLVLLAKAQNTTSVADFVASRYGKADKVAVCVTLLCVIGTIPYIALQLKAVAAAMSIVIGSIEAGHLAAAAPPAPGLTAPILLARLRHRLRDAARRRDRPPGRADAGGRRRIRRQAAGLSRRRHRRHLGACSTVPSRCWTRRAPTRRSATSSSSDNRRGVATS